MLPSKPISRIALLLQLSLGITAIPIDNSTAPVYNPNNPTVPSSCKISPSQIPDLIDITIDEITSLLQDNCFTSYQLTQAYISRINEVNDKLHPVEEINPDALEIAKSLDAERKSGKVRGPLHGIPILVKDNIATFDKMNTTASSFALLGAKPPADSTVAAKLREAGAIILGKTSMSEWANFRSNNSTSGWGARHGQLTSAYYPNMDPSGSSGGSGVASSIGLSLACLGTETAGSIISPAERNNLVGIKPTVGLTSRHLVIPISEHQDTIGPMARTVKDAAYLLSAIAGKDSQDNYTSAIPFYVTPDYWKGLELTGLKGVKIGVPRNEISGEVGPHLSTIVKAFNNSVEIIRGLGATIFENANFPELNLDWMSGNMTIVTELDFKTNLKQYLSQLTTNPNNITSLQDLAEFTKTDTREAYPDRDIALWEEAFAQPCEDNTCEVAFKAYQANEYMGSLGSILGALENGKDSLDALILPAEVAPFVAAIAGFPIVTVPMGFFPPNTTVQTNERGLVFNGPNQPIGLAFLGRKFDEQRLIGYAYAFEQATKVREKGPKPYLTPKAQVKDFM
ncbi:hypothetical protein ABW20_dc0102988 [Dactylellina cionopaga]|nr:hypothetical protein ABW20_dc0102988 [Dactylellina cionopaga]